MTLTMMTGSVQGEGGLVTLWRSPIWSAISMLRVYTSIVQHISFIHTHSTDMHTRFCGRVSASHLSFHCRWPMAVIHIREQLEGLRLDWTLTECLPFSSAPSVEQLDTWPSLHTHFFPDMWCDVCICYSCVQNSKCTIYDYIIDQWDSVNMTNWVFNLQTGNFSISWPECHRASSVLTVPLMVLGCIIFTGPTTYLSIWRASSHVHIKEWIRKWVIPSKNTTKNNFKKSTTKKSPLK